MSTTLQECVTDTVVHWLTADMQLSEKTRVNAIST